MVTAPTSLGETGRPHDGALTAGRGLRAVTVSAGAGLDGQRDSTDSMRNEKGAQ